jgi:LacI family transcriptional regulator
MSITHVAKEAGVSHATVSYVINGKDGVSEATAKRVQLAMKKLNYIPRSRMKKRIQDMQDSLVGLRHGSIGLVFYGRHANLNNCPLFARLTHSIEEELRERKISLMLIRMEESECRLNESKIDGSVIIGSDTEPLQAVETPCVSVFGHPDISEPLMADHIEPANDRIGVLAANYFASRGHKKVLFLNPRYLPLKRHIAIEIRQRVFVDYAKKAGLDVEVIHIPFSEYTDEGRLKDYSEIPELQKFIQQFESSSKRPTGIFVPMDAYLVILQKGFFREGIKPGKDVEFIGCNNDTSLLEGLDPCPATIDMNPQEMAKSVVERLLYRIGRGDNGGGFVQIEIQPRLVEAGLGVRQSW